MFYILKSTYLCHSQGYFFLNNFFFSFFWTKTILNLNSFVIYFFLNLKSRAPVFLVFYLPPCSLGGPVKIHLLQFPKYLHFSSGLQTARRYHHCAHSALFAATARHIRLPEKKEIRKFLYNFFFVFIFVVFRGAAQNLPKSDDVALRPRQHDVRIGNGLRCHFVVPDFQPETGVHGVAGENDG